MSRKRFCFTLNNYGENDLESIKAFLSAKALRAIVGREFAPTTGTPHLQGYAHLREGVKFSSFKDAIHPRAHVELARGSGNDNWVYCSKSGDYWTVGTEPSCGKSNIAGGKRVRDELAEQFVADVGDGRVGLRRFAESNPGTWYFSGSTLLRNYHALQQPVHRPGIQVEWYFGPPGTGKSRKAHSELKDAYIKDPRTKWWHGYFYEKNVIIDDFGPGGIDINHLLRWFDRYKCVVETKGGEIPLVASRFIVTSNFHPKQCFMQRVITLNDVEDHPQLPALLRRIKLVEFH